MKIDRDMIEHMDHVALDIDPEKFVGGVLLTKQEAKALMLLAGYEPEPKPELKYEEWEIRINSEENLAAFNSAGGSERSLAMCERQPNFVCFHYMNGAKTRIPGDVPNWLRVNFGETMYVRFVKKG